MSESEVKFKRYTVSFNPAPPITPASITISPMNEERTIPIEQGITFLVFHLETAPSESPLQAHFPTYPIEWFVNEPGGGTRTVPQPESFQVQLYNEHRCTIVAYNSALLAENNEHPFNVLVFYDGHTYGTDPTIINLPPG